MAMKNEDAAYLAGLFDGEGCISSHQFNGNNTQPTVIVSISQKTEFSEVLKELFEKLGYGNIADRANGMTTLTISNKKDIRSFIKVIYPYSRIKREQLLVGYLLAGLAGRSHSRKGNKSIPIPARVARRAELHQQLSQLKRRNKCVSTPRERGI